MPLYGIDLFLRRFQRFHDAVACFGRESKAGGDLSHSLVMGAVDKKAFPVKSGQEAAGMCGDLMDLVPCLTVPTVRF